MWERCSKFRSSRIPNMLVYFLCRHVCAKQEILRFVVEFCFMWEDHLCSFSWAGQTNIVKYIVNKLYLVYIYCIVSIVRCVFTLVWPSWLFDGWEDSVCVQPHGMPWGLQLISGGKLCSRGLIFAIFSCSRKSRNKSFANFNTFTVLHDKYQCSIHVYYL